MARDGSGNYSLPAGNPVASGTTILASWANPTLSDIATELTDSLSRSGNGSMLAGLKGFAGTVSLPGYAFSDETSSGLYLPSANNVGLAIAGVQLMNFTTGAVTIKSTDAGATAGPTLTLHRDSASPADADLIGALKFDGEDDGGTRTTFASIEAQIDDVTNGTEDGTLLFKVMQGGTLTTMFDISAGGISFTGDQTVDSLTIDQDSNAVALTVDTEATSAVAVDVLGDTLTTGIAFRSNDLDALTTGYGAFLASDSASTSTRTLVELRNTNTLATGTTVLNVRQDAAAVALSVDQNANATGINLVTSATSSYGLNLSGASLTTGIGIRVADLDALTSGYGLFVASNSSSTSTRTLAEFRNDHASASNTTVLTVRQDSGERGTLLDQNGEGAALYVDTEATGFAAIWVDAPATTTGTAAVLICDDANDLTTGGMLYLKSASADTSTRVLTTLHNDNSLATGTTVLQVIQDANQAALQIYCNDASATQYVVRITNEGTGYGLNINQDGVGTALYIDSEATTEPTIYVNTPQNTTDAVMTLSNANSLTTGEVGVFYSNSASTNTRNLIAITNDNTLATGATGLYIQQDANQQAAYLYKSGTGGTQVLHIRNDGTGAGAYIDQNGNGPSLSIDSEATSGALINLFGIATTTGAAISATVADSLTTGRALYIISDSASTSTRNLVEIINNNTLATGTRGLLVRNDAAEDSAYLQGSGGGDVLHLENTGSGGRCLYIDHDPNSPAIVIDSESTTNSLFFISDAKITSNRVLDIRSTDALTSGNIIYAASNSADTSSRNLVLFVNDNTLATGANCLALQQDSSAIGLFVDMNGNGRSVDIDTEATTQQALRVYNPQITSANVVELSNMDALTSGRGLYVHSNSADTSARYLAAFVNDNTLATGCVVLRAQQDADLEVVSLRQNGDAGFIDFSGVEAGNTTDPVSSLSTAGTIDKWIQIELNGSKRWLPAYNDPS